MNESQERALLRAYVDAKPNGQDDFNMHHWERDVRAILAQPEKAAVPVAWRWKRANENYWNVVGSPVEEHVVASYNLTQEPLYSAPMERSNAK